MKKDKKTGVRDHEALIKELALFKKAEKQYNIIRNDNTDIVKIANNTKLDVDIIRIAKEHLFMKEHEYRNGLIARFDPSMDAAEAWERMTTGNGIKESDSTLIMHEYTESKLMEEKHMVYEDAHDEVNKVFNWEEERVIK